MASWKRNGSCNDTRSSLNKLWNRSNPSWGNLQNNRGSNPPQAVPSATVVEHALDGEIKPCSKGCVGAQNCRPHPKRTGRILTSMLFWWENFKASPLFTRSVGNGFIANVSTARRQDKMTCVPPDKHRDGAKFMQPCRETIRNKCSLEYFQRFQSRGTATSQTEARCSRHQAHSPSKAESSWNARFS